MKLNTPLSQITGIGPTYAKRLERLNILTVEDLIYHFPFRYEDFSKVIKIASAKLNDKVTLKGDIWQIKNAYTKFKKVITKAILNDGSGSIDLTWFNQPYLTKVMKVGDSLSVAGKLSKYGGRLTIVSPDWEKAERGVHTGRLVPVYPETYGISSKWIRNQINKILPSVLPNLLEFLPDRVRNNLVDLPLALSKIHFPKNEQDIIEAKERLSFDELFLINLATQKFRLNWQEKAIVKPWHINKSDLHFFINSLPFKLTTAQNRVISEITTDLKKNIPMNRLLQGEVGSGKTVVAASAVYLAKLNGFKTLLMAPTEILSWQHYDTLQKVLGSLGVSIGLYTGSKKFNKGKGTNEKPLTLHPDVIVGTHALLSDKLTPNNVGLVIIDEQHRFGVQQRTLLRQKGISPHVLTTTATPIPRTVALTIYGDLDISIIDELPKGRQLVKTYLVADTKRDDAYKFIEKRVKAKDQVYIITPLIDESETLLSAKAAKVEYDRLKQIFSNLRLGLLHGRLKSKDKEQAITDFKNHKIDILVSTCVVEVGVDIPNATIIMIEGAQRFGLAQLHQLRGRVGRSTKQSYCLLFSDSNLPQDYHRLKVMEKIHNGLDLAELDLKIRGAGEIFGTAQHGRFNLKLARLTDLPLIEKTKHAASMILQDNPSLDKYHLLLTKLASLAKEVAPD